MSERYTKVFSLPLELYAQGSPLVISAGNLLKDNETGRILAQLKLQNISPKAVKAATVVIHALDTMGQPLDGDTTHEYLDLSADQGSEFGQKTAIPLPNPSTRGFMAEVRRIIFADNTLWTGTEAPWEPLPAPESLDGKLGDHEMVKQFKLKYGRGCAVVPQAHKDLWRCACSTWNTEDVCYRCGKTKDALLAPDLEELAAEKDARLAQEKADRKASEAAKAVASKRRKKIITILASAVAVGLTAFFLVTKVIIPNSSYNKALALYESEQYEEAITAFTALDGYKDSEEQIKRCQTAIQGKKYAAAVALLDDGRFKDAIDAFVKIRGFKDSEDKLLYAADQLLSGCHMEYIRPTRQSDTQYETTYTQDEYTLSLLPNNRFEASQLVHFTTVGKKGYEYFNSEWDSMTLWSGTYRVVSIGTRGLTLAFDIESAEHIMYYGTNKARSSAANYLYYEAVITLNKEGKPEEFFFDNYGKYSK